MEDSELFQGDVRGHLEGGRSPGDGAREAEKMAIGRGGGGDGDSPAVTLFTTESAEKAEKGECGCL